MMTNDHCHNPLALIPTQDLINEVLKRNQHACLVCSFVDEGSQQKTRVTLRVPEGLDKRGYMEMIAKFLRNTPPPPDIGYLPSGV